MRILIIDPHTLSIYERDRPEGLRISFLLGGPPMTAFVIHHSNQNDYCYVDSDGLLKYDRYFVYALGHRPYYAGLGIIEGMTSHGRRVAARTSLLMLKSMIRFSE